MKKFYSLLFVTLLTLGMRAQTAVIKGDANGDGRVTMADATMAAKAYLGCNPTGLNVQAADIDGDGEVTVDDANAIINIALTGINGHEYVEIAGLKWATMNIGATTVAGSYETSYGDYFAWGEVTPRYKAINRSSATAATFAWINYSGYRGNPSYVEAELDADHDAATQAWGYDWRTPTDIELRALVEACTGSDRAQRPTELTGPITQGGIYILPADQTILPEYTGVAGRLFVDQKDITKRLFFPMSGYVSGTTMRNAGTDMETWSSSLKTDNTSYAYMMLANTVQTNPANIAYRSDGLTVRAVSGVKLGAIPVVSITDDYHITNVKVGTTKVLHVVILPNNATNRTIEWISSDPSIATVSYHGGVSATFTALKPGIVTITCRAKDGSGTQETMEIEVVQSYDYVEIGGLKWATKNLGALSDKGDCNKTYGDYFAWAETTPRYNTSTITSWEQMKFSDWKAEFPNGYSDNPSSYSSAMLDSTYDPATKEIGEGWRTPTIDDFKSLLYACGGEQIKVLKSEITIGGIYRLYVDQTILPEYTGTPGLLFVDENDINKRIFLPYQGELLDHKSTHSCGKVAWYATAQFDTDAKTPYVARFQSGSPEFSLAEQAPLGVPVRAVKGVNKPTAISLDANDIEITQGNSVELVSGFTPQWITDPTCKWISSNESVVTVTSVKKEHSNDGSSATAVVKALKAGTATITCISMANANLKATCQVTVKEPLDQEGGHAYVIMGGVTWSAMNVGATTIAGSYKTCVGDYYAFGETTPRYSDIYRDADGYVHVNSWKSGFESGYANDKGYGTDLDADHDVAKKLWGSYWRVPTSGEVTDLIMACVGYNSMKTSVTPLTGKITKGGIYRLDANQKFEADYTGVEGYLFVSKDDITKKLFFPKSGSFDGVEYQTYETYYTINQGISFPESMDAPNWSANIWLDAENSSCIIRDVVYSVVGRVVRPVFMPERHLNSDTKILEDDPHDFVEIGGVKWATMNIGATTVAGSYSTACGDFIAWSENKPRYNNLLIDSEGAVTSIDWTTKYSDSGYLTSDAVAHDFIGKEDEDYVTIKWGKNWRTPTAEEYHALVKACGYVDSQITLTPLVAKVTKGGIYYLTVNQWWEPEYTGVAGVLFVDESDISKRLFFPASGGFVGKDLLYNSRCAVYWTGSCSKTWDSMSGEYKGYPLAMDFMFGSGNYLNPTFEYFATVGGNVRAVVAEGAVYKPAVSSINIKADLERGYEGAKVTFRTNVYPNTASNYFKWTVSDPTVAELESAGESQTMTVKCLRAGKVIVTATATDGSGVSEDYLLWVDGFSDGLRYVDLGLSAKWATKNIGAATAYDAGDLFAWGETTRRTANFDWEHYKYCISNASKYDDRPWNGIDKYQGNDSRKQFCAWYEYLGGNKWKFIGDNKRTLEPIDDAATARYGSNWRMPSKDEMTELVTYCRWDRVTVDGKDAFKVTSKVPGYEGNCIYIPAFGLAAYPIWTSTRGLSSTLNAWALDNSYKDGRNLLAASEISRMEGCSVRPVYNEKSYGLEAKGHDYVDLGLSVNWATANVGATSPEETGTYVSWGNHSKSSNYEIEQDDHVFKNSRGITYFDYKKYQIEDKVFEGMWYNTFSKLFIGDGLTTLQPEDDFAKLEMRGGWRMPTKLEFAELIENCTHTTEVINGVSVDKFTSKVPGYEGRFIIIPRSGIIAGTKVMYDDPNAADGKSLHLWTSNIGDETQYATVFQSYAGTRYGFALTSMVRYAGVPVRGVLPK